MKMVRFRLRSACQKFLLQKSTTYASRSLTNRQFGSLLLGVGLVLATHGANAQLVAPVKDWDRVYGGYETERLNVVIPTADGGYLLGQHSQSGAGGTRTQPSQGGADYFIVKIGADGSTQWDRRYGGTGDDNITCIKQAPDGGYFLGGTTRSEKSGDVSQPHTGPFSYGESIEDFWIVRIDAQGNKLWDRRAGGDFYDNARAMCLTPDGGVLVAGGSNSEASGTKSYNNRGVFDMYLVKIDKAGIIEWDEQFGGAGDEEAFDLQPTTDGGYLLAGYSDTPVGPHKTSASKGKLDYWLVKLSADGKKQWDRSYGGDETEYLTTLTPASDGGWLLGGRTYSGASGDKSEASRGNLDYWVLRLDAQYNKVWDKTVGGAGDDVMTTAAVTPGNGWLLGGTTNSDASGDKTQGSQGMRDYWVVSLTPQGTKQWDARFGGGYDEIMTGVLPAADGGILLSGTSLSLRSGDKSTNSIGLGSGWLVKLRSGGFVTSARTPAGHDDAWQVYPNPAHDYLSVRKIQGRNEQASFELRDAMGRLVRQATLSAAGTIPSSISLTGVPTGVYSLLITDANATRYVHRITIQ
ncbi:T9SS type A sorting domain-containing protein [Hymenobacter sp. DG01]|uniref:T9SS type A sorting domain-containing protein n=1 Tax=Hymenobacter sp. DG01 TaxID=2584940 RepID=UPI00112326EC|nr:T9SS type A sorting domain-containing protein [Hymenobacter sp. DG01]